jgi:hypothetical protein
MWQPLWSQTLTRENFNTDGLVTVFWNFTECSGIWIGIDIVGLSRLVHMLTTLQ